MNAYHDFESAVYIYGNTTELVNCRFINNTTANQGGGAVGIEESTTTVTDCVFIDNSAAYGGAIHTYGGHLQMSGCVFMGNSAAEGGALYHNDSYQAEVSNCTFFANIAAQGAAVYLSSLNTQEEAYSLTASIISGNSSGEGLYWDGTANLGLANCDIHGNAGGDWVGHIAEFLDVDGNFSLDPMFCDVEVGNLALWEGSPCLPENSPGGVLVGALGQGCTTTLVPPAIRGDFALRSYPNPSNPQATVSFTLERSQPVRIEVYALDGRRIVRLADRVFGAGRQNLTWDGRDTAGNSVASGTYLVQLIAADGMDAEKIMLIK